MRCGDTLLFDPALAGVNEAVQIDPSATPNPHPWVVLTEPRPPDYRCVIVNITGHKPNSDKTVVLHPGDHPLIKKDSVIRYSDALVVDALQLDEVLKSGMAKRRDPCSPDLLKRIQDGLKVSIFTKKKIVNFFEEHKLP